MVQDGGETGRETPKVFALYYMILTGAGRAPRRFPIPVRFQVKVEVDSEGNEREIDAERDQMR